MVFPFEYLPIDKKIVIKEKVRVVVSSVNLLSLSLNHFNVSQNLLAYLVPSEIMLTYLPLDIICSSKLTVIFELHSRKTVRISGRNKFSAIVFLEHNSRKTVSLEEKIMFKTNNRAYCRANWRLLRLFSFNILRNTRIL